MPYRVKLKTGFYETIVHNLFISQGIIQLIPQREAAKNAVEISEEDVVSIIFRMKKNLELEIQTRSQVLTGILFEDTDLEELRRDFRKNIRKKMIFEEF